MAAIVTKTFKELIEEMAEFWNIDTNPGYARAHRAMVRGMLEEEEISLGRAGELLKLSKEEMRELANEWAREEETEETTT